MAVNLETIRVAEPCREDWDAMDGDGQARHCARCRLHVTDLSSLTRAEAEEYLSLGAPDGRRCVRYTLDASGAIVTRTSERARLLGLLRVLPGGAP